MTDPTSHLPEHVLRNRAVWDRWAPDWVAGGERNWAAVEPTWGIWGTAESELGLVSDIDDMDVIELGCGTAYVCAWLARRGARPVGIDNSPKQLDTALRLQAEHGLAFPLILGNSESVPYPDASFDLAISEYGAAIWADPYGWIPEAARLLRPGGRLVFLINGYIQMLCAPDSDDAATDTHSRPVRVARIRVVQRRVDGVPPAARRDDPSAQGERLRGRGSHRDPGAGRGDHPARLRHRRMGPPLAE